MSNYLLPTMSLSRLENNTCWLKMTFSEKAQCLPITYANCGGSIAEGNHLYIGLDGIVNGVVFNNAIIDWQNTSRRLADVNGELEDLINSACTAIKQYMQNNNCNGFCRAELSVGDLAIKIYTYDHKGQVCKLN